MPAMSIAIANRIRMKNMCEYNKLLCKEKEKRKERRKKMNILWIFKR